MNRLITLFAAASLVAISQPALASPPEEPGSQSAATCSPGQNQDLLVLYYQLVEPTGTPTPTEDGLIDNLGGALAGGFYGNTANSGADADAPDSGHGVTPSISPGPQALGSGGPGTGTSIGEFIQLVCSE
jgi:hypothetical protein